MQALIHRGEQTYVPLGYRRGISDLARFSLDLTWASAETECHLGTRAYPSPPMTGTPPPPPKPTDEAGDRGQGGFQASGHDVYRPGSTIQGGDVRGPTGLPPPQTLQQLQPPPPGAGAGSIRHFPPEAVERGGFPYRRPEETTGRSMGFPSQPNQMIPPAQYSLPPVAGGLPAASPYSLPARQSALESPSYTSPKSQRKTKGHVASACVPCKRAHLRCDAQRPCSRCLSNGKEDACVDVQHKKRGRPRLRDDRETRFDTSRFQHPADSTTRRPVSLYAPASAAAAPFEDPLRRSQSYRVLKSHPTDPPAPRYLERGSAGDINLYPPPLTIPSRQSEPVAYLTVDLEIAKVSSTFVDAIGAGAAQSIQRRNLGELVINTERERVAALQRSLLEEQGRKDPNYLPPIFARQDIERVIQSLPFDQESLSRLPIDKQDFFTFVTADGQTRSYQVRVGLAKQDSVYFVVLLLQLQPRLFPQPSPSPHPRDIPYAYQPPPYSQLTPVSGSFDQSWQRFGNARDSREGGLTRPPTGSGQMMASHSPGVSPNVPSYSPSSSSRVEHPSGPSYQIPRSELPPSRVSQQPGYQLPPIRSQGPLEPSLDARGGRVDIGGLIDQPNPSWRAP